MRIRLELPVHEMVNTDGGGGGRRGGESRGGRGKEIMCAIVSLGQ